MVSTTACVHARTVSLPEIILEILGLNFPKVLQRKTAKRSKFEELRLPISKSKQFPLELIPFYDSDSTSYNGEIKAVTVREMAHLQFGSLGR